MNLTPHQTMLVIWQRFHRGDIDSFEIIEPLLHLRRIANEMDYQRYYRKVEKLADQLVISPAAGVAVPPGPATR